jgi:hypothetical protein
MSFAQVLGEREIFERVSIKLLCKEGRDDKNAFCPDKENKLYWLVLTIVLISTVSTVFV